MRLLRLGCRAHRLAAGMARIGSDLLPTPQRFRAAANWLELVRQGVLDGALISGLELEAAAGLNDQELELLPLGELPLALAFCPEAPGPVGAAPGLPAAGGQMSEVLVPDRGVAPGLWRLLQELGLSLHSGGNSLQTPNDWIGRIQGSALALVVADREADTWAALQRWPRGPCLPAPLARCGWCCRPTGSSTRCCATPPWSWAGSVPRNSWRVEILRPVPRTKIRGCKRFCCAAASLPLGADWPQHQLTPMPFPPLQADHPLTPWP